MTMLSRMLFKKWRFLVLVLYSLDQNLSLSLCPCIYIYRDLLEKLAHVIIDAKKSHIRPHASWRTRETNSTVQSMSKGLRTKEANGMA